LFAVPVCSHQTQNLSSFLLFFTPSSQDISAVVSIGALVVFSVIFAGLAEYQWQQDVTPFTLDEWIYAAKGGYLDTMTSHYIRNGGL
jgi:hypothetical protein